MQRLRVECSRFATSRTPSPQLNMLLQLPEEAFTICPKVASVEATPPLAHLGVLLEM